MKTSFGADHPFVPASHENPLDPGVWKKVLFPQADLQSGVVQMVNWARLPAGKRFAAHYHEDMQEIFVILQGEAHLQVGADRVVMRRGDAVRAVPIGRSLVVIVPPACGATIESRPLYAGRRHPLRGRAELAGLHQRAARAERPGATAALAVRDD